VIFSHVGSKSASQNQKLQKAEMFENVLLARFLRAGAL